MFNAKAHQEMSQCLKETRLVAMLFPRESLPENPQKCWGNFYVWLSSNFEKSCEAKILESGDLRVRPPYQKIVRSGDSCCGSAAEPKRLFGIIFIPLLCFDSWNLFSWNMLFLTQIKEQCSLYICKNNCFCIVLFLKFCFFFLNTQQMIFFFLSFFL